MASRMKTTVQISDALLADIHKIAAMRKTTLKALIDEGLRHVVERERMKKKPFKLKDGSIGGQGLTKEFENADWEQLRDLVYEGRGS